MQYTCNGARRKRGSKIEARAKQVTPGISYFSAAKSKADRSSVVVRALPASTPTQQTMRSMVSTTRVGSSNWTVSSMCLPCGRVNMALKKPDAIRRVMAGTRYAQPSLEERVTAASWISSPARNSFSMIGRGFYECKTWTR